MKRWSILVVMMCLVLMNYSALAYDTRYTHPQITEQAIGKSILSDYLKSYLGLPDGIKTLYDGTTISKLIQKGSVNEDATLISRRALNHFWNPIALDFTPPKNEGLDDIFTGYPNSDWALGVGDHDCVPEGVSDNNFTSNGCNDYSWKKARYEFYQAMTSTNQVDRDNHFKNMYESLGRILHLIEDMGVPAHTRNDFHGHLDFTGFSWPLEIPIGNLYEYHVEELAGKNLTYISGLATGVNTSMIPTFDTPQEYWGNGNYTGLNPDITINNTVTGLAEYSNANFLSRYTIFTDTLPQEDKHYFPFPKESSLKLPTPLPHIITAEDGKTDQVVHYDKDKDGEQINTFVGAKYVWDKLNENGTVEDWRLSFFLDDTVHDAYAQKLIPKTIGYAAGLINYFFRGTLSITYNTIDTLDDSYRIHLSVTNTTSSNEEMDMGNICLVITYPNGYNNGYIVVPEENNINQIPRGVSVPLTFKVPRGGLPDNQLNGLLDLIVVYKGNLSKRSIPDETDAVCVGYQQIQYFGHEYLLVTGINGDGAYWVEQVCPSILLPGCRYKLTLEKSPNNSDWDISFIDMTQRNLDGVYPYAPYISVGDVIYLSQSETCHYKGWILLSRSCQYRISCDFVLTNLTTGFEVARSTLLIRPY